MGTPRVLILGHSFIRRLHDFIESDSGHLDLTFHLSASALISWHGIGGHRIAKTVKFDLHILHSFRPDIVIVQLGTNYLTSCPPLQVGSALEDFVHLLHNSYSVRGECVCQTIRRRPAVAFNQRVDILTRYLRVVLEPIPYAIYWGHRGFWRACNCFFSADGIHLNSRGQFKLYRSLRGAVLKSLRVFTSDGNQYFFVATIPFAQMLCSAVNLWTKPNSVCVSLILVVAVYLRTALAACQPLILLFSVASYLLMTLAVHCFSCLVLVGPRIL